MSWQNIIALYYFFVWIWNATFTRNTHIHKNPTGLYVFGYSYIVLSWWYIIWAVWQADRKHKSHHLTGPGGQSILECSVLGFSAEIQNFLHMSASHAYRSSWNHGLQDSVVCYAVKIHVWKWCEMPSKYSQHSVAECQPTWQWPMFGFHNPKNLGMKISCRLTLGLYQTGASSMISKKIDCWDHLNCSPSVLNKFQLLFHQDKPCQRCQWLLENIPDCVLFRFFFKVFIDSLWLNCSEATSRWPSSNGSAPRSGTMSIKPPSSVSDKTEKGVHDVRFLCGPLRSGLNTLSSVSGSLLGARCPVTLPNEGSLRVQHVTVGTGRPEPSTFN